MTLGIPVSFDAKADKKQFKTLIPISTRRNDLNTFDEDLLQQLIADAPSILPVREFLPSTVAVFSLGREIPVDIGDSEGFIDNLLVTNDGYLVIVETKLYRNPEATRNVVTQTLQYGMAVGRLSTAELETRIRRGQKPALRPNERISDCVARLVESQEDKSVQLSDDFDQSFERNLRRGEFLLLVVSDGIRVGVERVTHWLNEQGSSSPFKFGLVELKFYLCGDQRIVIPRTTLRTLEVARHVVVVDIQPKTEVDIVTTVTGHTQSPTGGKKQEARQIKPAAVPLSTASLLNLIRTEDRQAASVLIDQLEIAGFDQQGTPASLKFGFTSDDGEFHGLVTLDKSGAWISILKKDAELLGDDAMLELRNNANRFAPFYKPEQLTQLVGFGCSGKYQLLGDIAGEFAAFLNGYKTKLMEKQDS